MQAIVCEQCGREFARIENKAEVRSLVVHPPGLSLKVASKQEKLGEIECPECHHPTKVSLDLFSGF